MPATLTRAKSRHRRFVERSVAPPNRIDEDQGVIFGVRIIGGRSRNNRKYTKEALRGAVRLYEGVKVFVDHPRGDSAVGERSFRDWAGVLKNIRYLREALYGDLFLRRSGSAFSEIIEAAQNFPLSFGLSHVADGKTHFDKTGVEIVESISEVASVDIVMDPATSEGLFESVHRNGPDQAAIENLLSMAVRFRNVATKAVEASFRTGDTSPLGDAIGVMAGIRSETEVWLQSASRCVDCANVSLQFKQLSDAIVDVLRDPTVDGATDRAEQFLTELVDLLRNLAEGVDPIADELEFAESFLPRKRSNDELREFAGRLLDEHGKFQRSVRDDQERKFQVYLDSQSRRRKEDQARRKLAVNRLP